MNKRIVAVITPFALKQNIYVYEDNNKIAVANVGLEDFSHTIFSLAKEHDVKEVNLIGSKQYNRGLAKSIEPQKNAYGLHDLEIKLS